jgi:hypothetical protein
MQLKFAYETLKPAKSVVLILALLYVALAPCVSWPLYHFLLFRPVRQTAPTAKDQAIISRLYKAKITEIIFPSANGALIHGRYFDLPGTNRVFLDSEGGGGNIYHRINHAQFLLQCGGSVLQYDYQGYGDSAGQPSLDGVIDDALAAYDYLTSKSLLMANRLDRG